MTIFAYTENTPTPAYVNLSERVSNPGDVILTVRSSGESHTSSIILSPEHLQDFVANAIRHLNKTSK